MRLALIFSPALASIAACERPEWQLTDSVTAGTSSSTASFGGSSIATAGSTSTAGVPAETCAFGRIKTGTKPIFAAQTVKSDAPARQELYTLVTDEEAEALRNGGPLVPPAQLGATLPDIATLLDEISLTSTELRKPLIQKLRNRFASVRTVWPNPWALRLVDHAGTEHMNPVRIVLKPGAWLARVTAGSLLVVDDANFLVKIDEALAHPENIAAIFYEFGANRNAPNMTDPCEQGYRALVMADDTMVEQWSLGTQEILDRMTGDLDLLNEFFQVARLCTMSRPGNSFHSYTVCTSWLSYNVFSEYSAYQWTLSTPSELYEPSPQKLASLIEALQADLFEPDPYAVGAAGGGPEGGAAGDGAGGAAGGVPGAGGAH